MVEANTPKEKLKIAEESVGILIIKNDQVLTVRHRAGTGLGEGVWGLPGGKKKKLNPETDPEAAIRELKQETGLETTDDKLIEFTGNYFEKEMPVNGHLKFMSWRVFICTEFTGELLTEPTEEGMPQWVPIERLNAFYETGPNVLNVIQNGQNYLLNSIKSES